MIPQRERKSITFGKVPEAAGHRIVLYGPGGIGKCLGAGTPVLMFDGTIKAVEDIREYDTLMGPDSEPRTVTRLHQGFGQLYRVIPKRGESFVCNGKHPIPIRMNTGNGNFRDLLITAEDFITSGNSMKRDAVMWRAPVTKAWPTRYLPIDPYLLGCWLADGTLGHSEITTMEPEVLQAMKDYSSSHDMVVHVRSEAGKAKTYSMVGNVRGKPNYFLIALRELGLDKKKYVPLEYATSSWDQRMELLAGMLDGDGYIASNGVSFDLVLKSKELSDGIVFVARSLGFGVSQAMCEKTCTNSENGPVSGEYWRVIIGGNTNTIPNRVPRRIANKRNTTQNALHVGFKVEPCGEGFFYGFEVDEDHLFMLGDFTVTHNTTFATQAPGPVVFFDLDDSLARLKPSNDVQIAEAKDWQELRLALQSDGWDSVKTIVIDSLTKAEELCAKHVIETVPTDKGNKVTHLEDYGWGKGQGIVYEKFLTLLSDLDKHCKANRNVILICHDCIANVANPQGEDWVRYEPRLQSPLSGKASIRLRVREWADHVLFLGYDVAVKNGVGQGAGTRSLYASELPHCMAKSRTTKGIINVDWKEILA